MRYRALASPAANCLLVHDMFPCLTAAMKMLDPHPEPVPLEEVAAVLAHAAARVPGGPPAMITASGRQLAAALQDAGYRVVRDQAPTCQLTL